MNYIYNFFSSYKDTNHELVEKTSRNILVKIPTISKYVKRNLSFQSICTEFAIKGH